jgi:hypothetical protein
LGIHNGLLGSLESDKSTYGTKQAPRPYGCALRWGHLSVSPGLKDWKASTTLNYGKQDSKYRLLRHPLEELDRGMFTASDSHLLANSP